MSSSRETIYQKYSSEIDYNHKSKRFARPIYSLLFLIHLSWQTSVNLCKQLRINEFIVSIEIHNKIGDKTSFGK